MFPGLASFKVQTFYVEAITGNLNLYLLKPPASQSRIRIIAGGPITWTEDDREPIFYLHGWDLEFVRNLAIQNNTPLTPLQESKYLQSANSDVSAVPNTAGQVQSKTEKGYFDDDFEEMVGDFSNVGEGIAGGSKWPKESDQDPYNLFSDDETHYREFLRQQEK